MEHTVGDASLEPSTPRAGDAPVPIDSTHEHSALSLSGTLDAASVELPVPVASSHLSASPPNSADTTPESSTAAHSHTTLGEAHPSINSTSMDIGESHASSSSDAMDVDAVGEEAATAMSAASDSPPVTIIPGAPVAIDVHPPVEGNQAGWSMELDEPSVTIEEEVPTTHTEEEEGETDQEEKLGVQIQPAPTDNDSNVPSQPVPLCLPVTVPTVTESALPGASIDSERLKTGATIGHTTLLSNAPGSTTHHRALEEHNPAGTTESAGGAAEALNGDTNEPMADAAPSRATSVSLESEESSGLGANESRKEANGRHTPMMVDPLEVTLAGQELQQQLDADFGRNASNEHNMTTHLPAASHLESARNAIYRSLPPYLFLGLSIQRDGDSHIPAIVSFLRRSSLFMVLSHADADSSNQTKWFGRGSVGLAGWDPSGHLFAPALPFSLTWLVDYRTQEDRSNRSDLSKEEKQRLPLLPHWTWSLPNELTDRESLLVACVVSAYPEILLWDESSAEPNLQSQQDSLLRRVLHLMRALEKALLSSESGASGLSGTLRVNEEDSTDELGCTLVFRFVQWDSAHMRDAALHQPRQYRSVLCNDSERLSGVMIDLSPDVMPLPNPDPIISERHIRVLQFHSRSDEVKDVNEALASDKPSKWIRYQPILPAPPMLSMGPNWPGFKGDPTLWLPLRSAGTSLPMLYALPYFLDAKGHAVRMGSVIRFREPGESSMFLGIVMACVVKISVSLRDQTLEHESFKEAEHDRAAIRERVQGGTATRFLVLRFRDEKTNKMAENEENVSIDHAELLRAIDCDQNTPEFLCETRCVPIEKGRYIDVITDNDHDDSTLTGSLSEPILSGVVVNEWSSSSTSRKGKKNGPATPEYQSKQIQRNVEDFFTVDRALDRWWPDGIRVLERNESVPVDTQATRFDFCRQIVEAATPGSFDVETQVRWFGRFVDAIPSGAGAPNRSVVFPWPPPVQKPKGGHAAARTKPSPAKRRASRSRSVSPEKPVTRRGSGKANASVQPEPVADPSSKEAPAAGRATRGKANKQQTPSSQAGSAPGDSMPSPAAVAATRTAERAAAIKEVCISLVMELSDPRPGVDLAIAPLRCAMKKLVPKPKKGAFMTALDQSTRLWESIETLDPLLAEHLRAKARIILDKKQTGILREVLDPIIEGLDKQDWRKGASGKSAGTNLLWMTAPVPGSRPEPIVDQLTAADLEVNRRALNVGQLEAKLETQEKAASIAAAEAARLKEVAAAATAAAAEAAAAVAAAKRRPPVPPAKPVPSAAAAVAGSPTRPQLTREERAAQREKEKMELEKLKQEQLQPTAKKVTTKSVTLAASPRKPVAGQRKRKRIEPSESLTEEKTESPPNEDSTPVPTVQQSPPLVSPESIAAAAAAAAASAIQPFQAEMRAAIQALIADRQVAQVNTSAQPPNTPLPAAAAAASSPMMNSPHPPAAGLAMMGTVDSPQLKPLPHETIPVDVNHHKSARTQVGQSPATGSRTYHQNQSPHDQSHQPQPYHHQSPPIRPQPVQGVPTQSQPAHHHPQHRVSPSVQQQLQTRFESTADLMNQVDDNQYDLDIDTSQALHGTAGVQRLQDDLKRSAIEAFVEQQQRQVQARHQRHQPHHHQQQQQQQLLHHLLANSFALPSTSARSSHAYGMGGDDLLRLLPPTSSAHQPFAPPLNQYAPTSFIGHPPQPSTLNNDQLRMLGEAIAASMHSSSQQPAYGSMDDERRIEFPGMHSRKGQRR